MTIWTVPYVAGELALIEDVKDNPEKARIREDLLRQNFIADLARGAFRLIEPEDLCAHLEQVAEEICKSAGITFDRWPHAR